MTDREIVERVRDIISHPSRYVISSKTVEEAMIDDIVELLQNNCDYGLRKNQD